MAKKQVIIKNLIRSSTMKCLVSPEVKNNHFNPPTSQPKVLNSRIESEGTVDVMDDFSMIKRSEGQDKQPLGPRFKTPLIVRWDITYRCNFKCRHCYSECESTKEKGVSLREAKKILDVLDNGKVQFVQILGGEPMMRSDILEIVKYATAKKFIFALNSNGYLLDEKAVKNLAMLGLKFIQISLHGLEKEHSTLTQNQRAFKKAISAIDLLIKNGVNVSVSCVVSEINAASIFDFIDHLAILGIKDIQLLTPLNEGRATDEILLSSTNFTNLKKKLITLKNQRKDLNFDLPGFDIDLIDGMANVQKGNRKFEFFFGCIGGVSGIRINPAGEACICVGSANNSFGKITEKPLDQIMEEMYEWRIRNRPRHCQGCDSYLNDCQGACYLRFH